jgi:hypothetical protein
MDIRACLPIPPLQSNRRQDLNLQNLTVTKPESKYLFSTALLCNQEWTRTIILRFKIWHPNLWTTWQCIIKAKSEKRNALFRASFLSAFDGQ